MHYITAVEYEAGYRLRLKFDDANVKIVDLEKYLDGDIFEPLRDMQYFRNARLNKDIDTVVWDNGADMSPDFLYEIGTSVQEPIRSVHAVAEERDSYEKIRDNK